MERVKQHIDRLEEEASTTPPSILLRRPPGRGRLARPKRGVDKNNRSEIPADPPSPASSSSESDGDDAFEERQLLAAERTVQKKLAKDKKRTLERLSPFRGRCRRGVGWCQDCLCGLCCCGFEWLVVLAAITFSFCVGFVLGYWWRSFR